MASEKEGQKAGGGGAVNDLTPPGEQTMKYTPNDQKTIQQAPPTGVQQNTVMQPPGSSLAAPISKPPSSLSGKGGAKSGMPTDFGADVALAVELQDLTGERLLMAAPRMESHGQQCPALNSIPLLAKIGQGGMGAVYYGIHPRLRSEVAVKVLPFHLAEQDPGMIRRFFREAQIAAQVRSPHLCNVMDVNEEAGLFFLVMEFVTGCTAGQYLKALTEKGVQGMPEKDVLDLIIAATEGLWAAHAQGVVHRDIKPDNIMIPYQAKGSKEYDLKRAKLMDLGLARSEESNQSLTGAQSAMGTPGYMAPEQAMDAKTADKRSDVFSMGATIYCLLAGRPPFKAETIMKVLMATMHEPHEPIIKHRPDVSPMLNEILEKTLAKKQDQRFSDAKQLNTALEDCRRLISGEGGAGAFSGAKTFTYATTPGSGTQDTFLNAGKPAAAGAQKSKGMMYIAAGVAVLAIGGGTLALLKKPPQGGTGPGPSDPGIKITDGGKTEKPPPPMTEQTKAFLSRHQRLIADALKSLDKGEIEDAKLSYNLAKDFELSVYPEAKKLEDEYETKFKNIERKKEFDAEIKEIDRLTAREEYMKALGVLNKWVAKPPDEASKKIAEDKEKSLKALYSNSQKKSDALKQLDAIAAYGPEKYEAGLDALAEIKKAYSKPEDEINMKAVALETKLGRAVKDRDNKAKFDRFMAEGKAAEAKKEYDQALTVYLEAKQIAPDDKNLIESLKRIQPLVNEAAADAAAKRLGAQVAELISKANEEFKAQKYDQALESLGTALNLKKDDSDALALKKRILDAQTEQANRDEAQRKRNIFTAQLESVRAAIAAGDLPDATEKLGKIDPSFKQDPALAAVNTELANKQAQAKAKVEYTAQLDVLRKHIRNGEAQAAQKLLSDLEQSPVADASLNNLKLKVTELVEEQKKIQDKEGEYKNLITAGGGFERTAEEKKEPSEKLGSYESALTRYNQAKNLKPGAEIDAKVAAVQAKINKVKADEEQARIAAAKAQKEREEREAQLKLNRTTFDERIVSAQTAIKTGDFTAAQRYIDEATNLFKDDPQLKTVVADLKSKQGESDTKVNAAIDLAASKAPKRQFDEALADLQTAYKTYPRRELTSAIDAVSQVKKIDGLAVSAAKSADARLQTLDTKANGKGKTERARVVAAQQRLQTLTDGALSTLARARFQNSALTLRDLDGDLSMRQRDLSDSLSSYENALKETTTSTTNQGDNDPFKENKKTPPPKKEDPKPNKNSGKNAGDVNPFD